MTHVLKDVVFPSKSEGWLDWAVGTVHDVKVWSETDVRVTSSGGGGFIHPEYGGTVHAPVITSSSSSHKKQSFWIKGDRGNDVSVQIPLRVADGHRVIIVWGAVTGKKEGPLLYARNVTTGEELHLYDASPFFRFDGKGFQKLAVADHGDMLASSAELEAVVAPVRDRILFGYYKNYGIKSILRHDAIFLGATLLLAITLNGFQYGGYVVIWQLLILPATLVANVFLGGAQWAKARVLKPILALRQSRLQQLNGLVKAAAAELLQTSEVEEVGELKQA